MPMGLLGLLYLLKNYHISEMLEGNSGMLVVKCFWILLFSLIYLLLTQLMKFQWRLGLQDLDVWPGGTVIDLVLVSQDIHILRCIVDDIPVIKSDHEPILLIAEIGKPKKIYKSKTYKLEDLR